MANSPTPTLQPFPSHGSDNSDVEPAFQRFMPLPTPQIIKDDYLFGIPLRSALTNQTVSDATIERFIVQSISEIEHEHQIYISPVTVNRERQDYSWNTFFHSYGFMRLNLRPILEIIKLEVSIPGPDRENLIEWPSNWIRCYNTDGTLQLTPLTGSGSVLTTMAGSGAVFPVRLFSADKFPQFWACTYRSGFDVDKTPAIISELVAVSAALKLLSMLGPILFPTTGYSIGIDGLSQSVSTPGPNYLVGRIQSLMEQREKLTQAVRSFYQINLHMAVLG